MIHVIFVFATHVFPFQISSCLLLQIKSCCLDRRFTRVAQLFFPSWINLVGIFLESDPYVPAFHNFHASSPCLHEVASCLGPSLWPRSACSMVLELRHLEACMHSVCWKSMALHLSETHGSDMDAACTNDAGYPYCVWGAGHCSLAPNRRQMFSWPNLVGQKDNCRRFGARGSCCEPQ